MISAGIDDFAAVSSAVTTAAVWSGGDIDADLSRSGSRLLHLSSGIRWTYSVTAF